MPPKKLSKEFFTLHCSHCRAYLCETDGVYLFVENLEILPKVRSVRSGKSKPLARDIMCGSCGGRNRIYLQKPPQEEEGEDAPVETRKFSIFRSRFEN